ncbi:MAG: cell division protein FtsQ/DivIB, partial [Pyrinomonadaceae bacterium]
GVWRADLLDLKAKLEKLPFIKSASVTRVLPGAVRVQVTERRPQAIVNRSGHEYLVDAEGEILSQVDGKEESLPFAMTGWDEAKTERAWKDNIERVKTYQKMLAEWRTANVLSKVEAVNLTDLREPRAIIEDSGNRVAISVGRENFGENLMRGVKAIVGKGEIFEAVNLIGNNMVLAPRKQN